MPDNTPKEEFDLPADVDFRFPGIDDRGSDKPDVLPDDVLNFTFDEVEKTPAAWPVHGATHVFGSEDDETERERRVDEVISAFCGLSGEEKKPEGDKETANEAADGKVNAVFDALKKRGSRPSSVEREEMDASALEKELFAALRKKNGRGAKAKEGAEKPAPAAGAASKPAEKPAPAAKAPSGSAGKPASAARTASRSAAGSIPAPAAALRPSRPAEQPARAVEKRSAPERRTQTSKEVSVPAWAKKPLSPWQQSRKPARLEPESVMAGRTLRGDQMLVYDSELDDVDYTDDEDLPELRDHMPVRFARIGRIGIGGGILYALFVISASIILACLLWMFASDVLALNKEESSAIVTIEAYEPAPGDPTTVEVGDTQQEIKVDIDQVATELKNNGLIEYKWLFKLFSQFSHAETKIDPGTYDVSTELDYRALVTSLQFGSGKQEVTRITFPEGYTIEQTFTLLEENQICRKAALYEAAADYDFSYDFVEVLETGDENRLEGYLFPDTYDFYQGEDATVAINRFLRNLDSKLTGDVRDAAAARGLSVRELLTLASLIEKEAGSDEERPIIASVIYNRLNAGMNLQLDSTLNYIKNTSTFDLTLDDMEIDDPYNTYLYGGLPPGPICSPGLASIQAAIDPASTDYWYWYAVDGETTFFTNYDEFIAFGEAHPYD